MFDFLRVFLDLFLAPLYAMDVNNYVYTVIYTVIITLAVWSFLRRVFSCIFHSI